MPTTIAAAIAAGVGSLTAGFTLGGAVSWALKAGALLTLNHLLTERPDAPDGLDITRTATFSSGPAKWVLGRAKVGGVVAFWAEDWDVPKTERGGPGADDLHLVIALSEGECDAIEGVWIGDEFFKVKFDQEEQDKYLVSEGLIEFENNKRKVLKGDELFPPPLFYKRRDEGNDIKKDRWDGTKIVRDHSFPLDLDPGSEAYFDVLANRWYDKPGDGRVPLDPDDEDDAEKIRRSSLSGAVSIWPYLNKDDYNNDTFKKFHSVRYYSDDVDNEDLNNSDGTDKATGFGDKWTENHRLDGIAAVHVRLRQWTKHEFEARVFKQGAPNLAFLIRGLRVEFPDPEKSTGLVTKWTDNAAAIRYWYHNVRREIDHDHIDRPTFVAAYKVCDKKTNPQLPEFWKDVDDDGVGDFPAWTKDQEITSFRKYSINGVLTSGDSAERIESEFDDHWQGVVVEDGGRLYYYPGDGRATEKTVGTITKDMVLDDGSQSSLQVTPAPAISQRVNAVNLTMAQSSWHDYLKHSLIEIQDNDKITQIDQNFLYPKNLGTWRWVINPIAANLLATINLRRARHSKTLSIKLPPGDNADTSPKGPVKFLAMSVGQIYDVEMPGDGIGKEEHPLRMMLLQKTINDDMTVNAVFIESPADIYDPNLELPRLEPPAPFVPSSQGALPPKPKNLQVFPYTRTTNNYFIKATITPNNFRKLFRLTIGDEYYDREIPHDSHEVYFEVSVPHQKMTMTVWNVQGIGGKRKSVPLTKTFTPDYSSGVLPAPVWRSLTQQNETLIATFQPEDYSTPITGMEIRFVASGTTLTTTNWLTGTNLTLSTSPIVANRPIVATIQKDKFTKNGQYTLYARFITNVSAVNGILSEISQGRTITINKDSDNSGTNTQEEADASFPGASANLYQLTEKDRLMMLPDRPSVNGMSAPDTAILMNGYTSKKWPDDDEYNRPDSAWPFGACEGYNVTLTESTHRHNTTKLLTSEAVTWYRTNEINLGAPAKSIQVRAKFESFSPPYGGGGNPVDVPDLALTLPAASTAWTRNSEISPITFPEATGGTTPITYTLTELPTGLHFAPATRRLTGTPTDSKSSGTMIYTATDSSNSKITVSKNLAWTLSNAAVQKIGTPVLTTSGLSHDRVTISWSKIPNATSYLVKHKKTGQSTPTALSPTKSLSVTINELSSSSTYKITVQALTTTSGYTAGDEATTTVTTEDQPTGVEVLTFTLETAGLGKIKVKDINTSANMFAVHYRLPTEIGWTPNAFGQQREVTISGLLNSQAYRVRVRGLYLETNSFTEWTEKEITTESASSSFENQTLSKPTLRTKTPHINDKRMGVSTTTLTGTKRVEIEIVPVAFSGYGVIDYDGNAVSATKETITKTLSTDVSEYEIRTTYPANHSGAKDLSHFTKGMQVKVRVRKNNQTSGSTGWTAWSPFSDNYILSGHPSPPSVKDYGTSSLPNPKVENFSWNDAGYKHNIGVYGLQLDIYHHNLELDTYGRYIIQAFGAGTLGGSEADYRKSDFNKPELSTKIAMPMRYGIVHDLLFSREGAGNLRSVVIKKIIPSQVSSLNGASGAVGLSTIVAAPSSLTAHLVEHNKVLLLWKESSNAVSYEIEHDGTPTENRTGITGSSVVFEDLPVNSVLTFKIKSHIQTISSDFVDFNSITTGIAPTEDDVPFEFSSTSPLSFSKSSDNRTISYSFQAETEGVDFYQIRYWQSTDSRIPDNDYALHDPQYITIDNTHTDGVETFTGTFDPGYSGRYYTAQIRAFVGTATDDYDRGFSDWHDLSNSESVNSTTLPNVFKNGTTLLTAPVLSVSQNIDDIGRPVITGEFTDLSGEWEEPTSNNSTISVDIETVVGAKDDYGNIGGIMTLYEPDDVQIVDDARKPFATKFVFTKNKPSPSVDGDEWNFKVIRKTKFQGTIESNTANIVVDIPAIPPQGISHITPAVVGTDVRFSWEAVSDVDGYEVVITEASGLASDTETSTIVQTSNAVSYLKVGGRNESFSISVRSYTGSANDRVFSDSLLYAYSSERYDDASLGKIRSLTASGTNESTSIGWGHSDGASSYEYQYSTDNGGTWSTSASTSTTSVNLSIVLADAIVRIRGFAGTSLSSPIFTSNSWSTIAYKADTSPNAAAVGDIRRVVAISKNNKIMLEWDAAPNADSYELEVRSGISWGSVDDDIDGTTFETTYASTESRTFRLRGTNDDDDGEWTTIAFTGDASISIAAPSVENIVSYTTVKLEWGMVPNAIAYDIEYRKSTTPVSAWTIAEHSHDGFGLSIADLTPNTLYNIRVRGTDGANDGAWTTFNTRTMNAVDVAPPDTITLVPNETNFIVSWTRVADATGYRVELSYSGMTSVRDAGSGDTQVAFEADDLDFLIRPVKMTARVKSLFHDYDGSHYSDQYIQIWKAPDTTSAQIAASVGSSIAGVASGANIPINPSRYRFVENVPPNEKALPYFSDSFDTLVWNTGVAIDSYALPYPLGGVQPYTIVVSGLPGGIVFDSDNRTITGTPTNTAPEQGYAIVRLIDANDLTDTRALKWVIGNAAPNTWEGTGTYADPYEITAATKINVRSLLKAGATNAADIEADTTGARGCVVWFVCRTQEDSIVRIHGAGSPDFDIVAKTGDDFLFSDTTDAKEMIDIDGHVNGVMIGVYKYASTTTATGSNATGDAIALEWFVDEFDTPEDISGSVGGASLTGYSEGISGGSEPEYTSEQVTDVYLLHKASPSDASYTITNLGSLNANGTWTGWSSTIEARVFRLEVHLKKWKNRALTGLTTEWKEISS